MNQEMRSRWRPKRNIGPAVLTCFTALIVYGLPAHGQQAMQGDNRAAIVPSSRLMASEGTAPSRWSVIAAATQCPLIQHWDPGTRMCMPDGASANTNETNRTPSRPGEIAPAPGPAKMPPAASSATADRTPPSGMDMPMPGDGKANSPFMFSLNQFLVYSSTSGPRGQTRLTGPGVSMLMYGNDLSPTNHLRIDVMGSLEQLTVGDKGTPQLLQTEHVDAMHAHDTIMALEFRDAVALSTADKQKVTFLFAPRGEAAVGPVPFMHRASAEGNPDAPLGHALQDGFHDVSTVFGIEYQIAHMAVEATAFSGQGISWPLPLHSPDSYSLRIIQEIDDHVSVGASYADVLLPDDMVGAEHNQFISGWLTTSHLIDGNALKSSLIWGQTRAGHGPALNSFLGEAVYQLGMNDFYGRAEILQITPEQLGVAIAGGASEARWVKAITVGYERNLFKDDGFSLFAGGSYTHDFTPGEFQPAYGSNPGGVKFYLRVKFDAL